MTKIITPRTLTIEGNASCQLRCPTCPTTSNGYPPVVGSGHLHCRDLESLLDKSPGVKSVLFENRGELFLNPELPDILLALHARNISASCESGCNFNTVSDAALEAVVEYRLKRLVLSIDGATTETYRLYRIGGEFEQVMENIRKLNALKAEFRTSYPRLTWQFVVFGHNEHELPLAREMAAGLGMSFYAKMSWDPSPSPVKNAAFVKEQTGWPAVTREELSAATGKDYMRSTCYALWTSPRVNWDGKVLGCCWNSWADFGGNAFTDGYESAANGPGISVARAMLLGQAPHRDDLPCSTCELYEKLWMGQRWLSMREIALPTRWWYGVARNVYRKWRFLQKAAPWVARVGK